MQQQQTQQGLQSIGQQDHSANKRVRLSGPSAGVHPQQNTQMNTQEFHQHQQNQILFNNTSTQQQQAAQQQAAQQQQQQQAQQQQAQQQQSFQQRFG